MLKVLLIILLVSIVFILIASNTSDYDKCYAVEESNGHASMGCCSGLVGGTRATEYLSESCIGCPYLTLVDKKKVQND